MNPAAAMRVRQRIGGILDKFVKLAPAVAACEDSLFEPEMLFDETGLRSVCLESSP